ncbi:DNA polymerase IV [Marmoricola endophyticus]|uniref:DNA polymerase IV n=1 Tax=Marmoricola endophyticus TaxID=2040280 RepID=A0A917BA84_9ACTN|nr:DNA polymerase IV [Marmoricola endophyticus]GGF32445.1 DNA polymerase IV [Marmoricola endophyticus]
MRSAASILHIDLDAFYAAVEQRDKPSLRGKPVVVGGIGGRGVVATASYEARVFGVHSAMPSHEARRRCPYAAFLTPRFAAYQETSAQVMGLLRSISPLVEPLSLDEAFVDLEAADPGPVGLATLDPTDPDSLRAFAAALKAAVAEVTGGLTGSVGVASSKLLAKIASDLDKPDGLVVVEPGSETDLLRPMSVGVIPGVGPATSERLRRIGVHTVDELLGVTEDELVRTLGQAHGRALHQMARARDDRAVEPEREAKSVSIEDTYDVDHVDRRLLEGLIERQAVKVTERLRAARLSGRTVTLKVRMHDFSTLTRSSTLRSPTDEPRVIGTTARSLLADLDTSGGVRLLGVGVSGLADWVQEDLFAEEGPAPDDVAEPDSPVPTDLPEVRPPYSPGVDVEHDQHGRGWVWGSGRGVVTVRFESADTGPGRVMSFPLDDPELRSLHRPRR